MADGVAQASGSATLVNLHDLPVVRSTMGYSHLRYFSAKSGQLGWGIPAGMGIATVRDKVLLVIGDGSFMYTVHSVKRWR